MSTRPTTLRIIARLLDIHVSTVSRVLNGDNAQAQRAASKQTIERIRAMANSMNYRPNTHATILKTRRSREIAVLVPSLSDIVLATIYEGIDRTAVDLGYTAFAANTRDNPDRQHALAEQALARNVDGLIISDTHCTPGADFLARLAARGVPFVLVSRRKKRYCSVSSDDEAGGRMAAQHLYGLGHTRVAVLAGQAFAGNAAERLRGFRRYYRQQGVSLPSSRIIHSPFDTEAGFRCGEQLLSARTLPTAFFAVNDFLAIGLMSAMRNRGLMAGRDMAVVGYNETPLAAHQHTPLTSISTCMYDQGRMAVELLIDRIEGLRVDSFRFPPVMTIRASSQYSPSD